MKAMLCALTMLATICVALAQEAPKPPEITGAFGYKLGEKYRALLGDTIDKDELNGNKRYNVKPPRPNKTFAEYCVVTTPPEGRILAVFALTKELGADEAMQTFGELKKELDSMYGATPKKAIPPIYMGCEYIFKGRKIMLRVNTNNSTRIVSIAYGFAQEKKYTPITERANVDSGRK